MWMLSKASYGDGMVVFSIEVGFGVCYVFEPHFLVVLNQGCDYEIFLRSPIVFLLRSSSSIICAIESWCLKL
jgi:hypothetical protein